MKEINHKAHKERKKGGFGIRLLFLNCPIRADTRVRPTVPSAFYVIKFC
jgi:hypothetical protein